MKNTSAQTTDTLTVHAFALENGFDRRTVTRRLKLFCIQSARRQGRYEFYRIADMERVMGQDLGDDATTTTAKPQPSNADFAEQILLMNFQNTSHALPLIVVEALKAAKMPTKKAKALALRIWLGMGRVQTGFLNQLLGKHPPLPVNKEIQDLAIKEGFRLANPLPDDSEPLPKWTEEELKEMYRRGDEEAAQEKASLDA